MDKNNNNQLPIDPEEEFLKKQEDKRVLVISMFVSVFYFGLGFTCLHLGLIEYGWAFFVLLPFTLGILLGFMKQRKWASVGYVVGTILFLCLLLFGGLEGIVCILMSLPLIVFITFCGAMLHGPLVKLGILKRNNKAPVFLAPLVVLLFGGPLESYFSAGEPEIVEVKTEQVFPYTCLEVYNAIKSVDTLDADKPFLMKLDLPIPQKCILEEEKVGALRTCYFEGGLIVERVTELETCRERSM